MCRIRVWVKSEACTLTLTKLNLTFWLELRKGASFAPLYLASATGKHGHSHFDNCFVASSMRFIYHKVWSDGWIFFICSRTNNNYALFSLNMPTFTQLLASCFMVKILIVHILVILLYQYKNRCKMVCYLITLMKQEIGSTTECQMLKNIYHT